MRSKFSPALRNVLIAAIIVAVIFSYLYWGKFSGNITGFFRIGSILSLSPYLDPHQVLIFKGEIGYDGQQFLSIALDPFLQNPDTLAALDHPSYRYRRIFYPLLGYLLGIGNPHLILYAMVIINLISILLLVWISSQFFKPYPHYQWLPLAILCIPGVWMVLSLSTADLLSSLFLVTALYGYSRKNSSLTAIALALGCLTRETMLLAWVGIWVASLWERQKTMVIPLIFAPIPAIIWNLSIWVRQLPGQSGVGANFGLPLVGIVNKLFSLIQNGIKPNNLFEAYLFGLLIAIAVSIFWIYRQQPRDNRAIFLITILTGALLAFSQMTILGYYLDYSRVYMDIYFLFLLVLYKGTVPFKPVLFGASGVASLVFLGLHS